MLQFAILSFTIYGLCSAQQQGGLGAPGTENILTSTSTTTTKAPRAVPFAGKILEPTTTTTTKAPRAVPFAGKILTSTTTTTTEAPRAVPFEHIPPANILVSTSTTTTTTTAAPVVTAPPPLGYVYGAFGQLCPAIAAHAMAHLNHLCKTTTDYAMDTHGVLDCDNTGACCLCVAIYCGYSGSLCREVIFGNYAAKFVNDIHVIGDPTSGAVVSCNGVEACLGATITASHVSTIDCDAARACQFAKLRITDPVQHFVIECGGMNSCDGMEIEINFSGAPPGYQCAYIGNPTYTKPVWQMEGIECGASGACNLLDITINNEAGCRAVSLELVDCTELNSCNGAVFDLIGDVTLQRCACGASCSSAVGLESCYNPNPNLYNPHLYKPNLYNPYP